MTVRLCILRNMRKTVVGSTAVPESGWLDLDALAQVEVSSEAPAFPAEGALVPGSAAGWQAAVPGRAVLAVRFDAPQTIGKVRLRFEELEHERSQEWALFALDAGGGERELMRQQWNFSPAGSTEQDEVYTLTLPAVAGLKLVIDPDRGRDRYPATLAVWRVG